MRRTGRAALAAATMIAALCAAPGAPAAPLPLTGTLDLATDADVKVQGPTARTRAGFSVAPAGDFNGDGAPDVLLGGRLADPVGREDAGAAWVVFGDPARPGRRDAPIDLAALGTGGLEIAGAGAGDEAGFDVASAGDVNGDGLADLLVGARQADPAGRRDAGAAYVVFGRKDPGRIDLAQLGEGGIAIAGPAAGAELGFSVASLPDLDGDGRRDLVVGAPRTDLVPADAPDGFHEGSAFVVFTPAAGTTSLDTAALGDAGYRIDADRPGLAGWSVAALGDLNGDGKPEVGVGAPFTRPNDAFDGVAYVVYGKATPEGVNLGALGAAGFALTGTGGEVAGGTMAGLGDVNGDGTADFAVSAQRASFADRFEAGRVHVIFGKARTGSARLAKLGGDERVTIAGAAGGDELGAAVSSAGDYDGDGRADLLLGAPYADPLERTDAGAAYVVFGREKPEDVDLALLGNDGVRIAGAEAGDITGRSVAGLGDISGDGRADVLIGRLFASPAGRRNAGAAAVVLGPEPTPPDPIETRPPDPGAEEEVRLDGCRAAANVEAIVDDSGSMSGTDPTALRARALKLLLTKERNVGERLGAVEFGSDSAELFFPLLIGTAAFEAERDRLLALVDERIQADAGGTDYNAGFTAAEAQNEEADARIFLTDGGHNEGRYEGLHRSGPRTFVIGLGIGSKGRDARRLQRIADDTKGRYYADVDDDELQPVLNAIDSRLNCDIDLSTFEDVVTDDGDVEEHEEDLEEGTNSGDLTVSWDDAGEDFDVGELEYLDEDGDVLARFGRRRIARVLDGAGRTAKRGGVELTGARGSTYLTLRVRGLDGGRVRFRVRATDVRGKRSRVVTQLTESRRRR